jgi:UDP-N-acetylmuramoyl-tripeptide--D-alanyl-D-alanine ligase
VIIMSLAEVAATTSGRLHGLADPSATVRCVVADSREAGPGSLFFALSGTRTDGHDHAADAVAAGAVAAVTARDLDLPCIVVADPLAALGALATTQLRAIPDITVVGITGSNGKTTTKDLIATVLGSAATTVAAPASYNGEVGLPISVLRASTDTAYLVLEYGARGIGHIAALAAIAPPRIAVVLGVGVAHLGEFGSREAIARAKAELVQALPVDGLAVLNADDPMVSAMRARTPARVVTFGRGAEADVRATDVTLDESGRASFVLHVTDEAAAVRLQLYGEHQVTNAVAAAAVAVQCGLSVEGTAEQLSEATPRSRWRMEVADTPDGVTVVNDAYNANPDSMAAALRALVALARGRRTWAVLGYMAELGPAAADAHREVGRLVAGLGIGNLVVVGEAATPIAAGAAGADTALHEVDDIAAAIALLRAEVAPGDVVLVKASRTVGLERVAAALEARAVPA